ncbi:MAG TPA: gamma-glutamyl-gamma-aminobutyrate hydrolase family protein [Acetobacteraceae bacterium]
MHDCSYRTRGGIAVHREVRVLGGRVFAGLERRFTVGRYHSICACRAVMPDELVVTAETADGVVMAIEQARLPIAAVQFHPESVMTPGDIGRQLIERVLTILHPGSAYEMERG